jgi:DNA sulfur modification protein DndD
MKLLSIKLCNFRQFYGKTTEIILASGKQNTTIIHGNNGAGKTTILNGFTWVLYEKFTAAFASPHLLINKRAINEANVGVSVDCWVEVQFEHENKRYQVKRKCYACRDKDGKIQYSQSKFFMLVAEDDGRWYPPLQQPDDIINRILPESLHQYFFFDGEHIDRIFRASEKSNMAEDTKELLGVKVLERAIEHLKKAKKTLQEELKEIGDPDTKKLLQSQSKLEKEKEQLQQRQQQIICTLAKQEDLKRNLADSLLKLSGAEELKRLKEKLEKQESNLRENLLEAKKKIKRSLSSRGYSIFLSDIISQFNSIIGDLRKRGELPSGIKQQFVQQLLDRKRCICGIELNEGSDPYQQVQEWMNRAGMADVEESAIRLESGAIALEKQALEFWEEVDLEQAKIEQWRTELAQIENELDDLRNKFRQYPDEDIQSIQKQSDEIEDSLKELIVEQGVNQHQIETTEKEIEEISKQVAKQKIKEEKQALAQRRIQITQDAIARLIEVKSRLEKQFRLSLEKRVQEIFSSISFTPYIPRISENYQLTLVENTSGIAVPVAASTGENQILSLSFIGGIIDRVREWSHKNTLMGLDSSTFPIVMDSPFGSLDEIYRRQVAKSIPQLANQLLVLVTKTQWRGELEEEISNYIGREYVLVYNSPKPDCEEDAIARVGKRYPLVRRSPNEFEYTEIIEVKKDD